MANNIILQALCLHQFEDAKPKATALSVLM